MAATPQSKTAPFHGLTELAARHGWRRLSDVKRGAAYLSERTVFRDSETGFPAWRLTCDPAVDSNDYYDIPAWNANGSLIAFLSRRGDGSKKRWLMDANGANLRPFPTPDGKEISTGYWSILYPDRFYHNVLDGKGTRVVATNPYTGAEQTILRLAKNYGEFEPPHPSEKWFLFGDRQGGANVNAPSMATIAGVDGTVQTARFDRRWHRLRFTKAPEPRIFYNYDDPREQFTIMPDGSGKVSLPDSGSHPDWLMGGKEITYYTTGSIWAVRDDGTARRLIMDLQSGGHGGPCLDADWYVSDTPKRGLFPGSILYLRTDGSQECHDVFKHQSAYLSHTSLWHPDHHTTHPHPTPSPDGTKVLFNSDFMGQYTDIYVSVTHLPDPPRDLAIRAEGNTAVLNWKEPRRCREIMGYLVYRANASGTGYKCLTAKTVAQTTWAIPQGVTTGYYVVTAREHSGLEGHPSNEASLGAPSSVPASVPPSVSSSVSPSVSSSVSPSVPLIPIAPAMKQQPPVNTTPPPAPVGLKIESVFANALRVSWKTKNKDNADVVEAVDHYNVYCGHAPDFACSQASLVASPSEMEMVDWGLELKTPYWYKVTAVDRAGNESEPSPVAQGATPAFTPIRVELKPDAANLKGIELADSAEAGGKILHQAKKNADNEAVWQFETPRSMDCAIWARATHDQSTPCAFQITTDDGLKANCRIYGKWKTWGWSPAGTKTTGSPQLFTLKAGKHTLHLKPITAALNLSALVITDDPTFPPK